MKWISLSKLYLMYVCMYIFASVTMKNGVFWDVTPCGSCGFYKSHTT
jgi:hypothetical protein